MIMFSGYSIGCRLIDEFLATSTQPKCKDFKEAVDVCAKVGSIVLSPIAILFIVRVLSKCS